MPINIQGFFQLSLGNWFVLRTSHSLGSLVSAPGATDLQVEPVTLTDQVVIQLCETVQVDPSQVLAATQLHWQGQGFPSQPPAQGSRLLVSISSQSSGQRGQLLGQTATGSIDQLEFYIDPEERLILTQKQGSMTREDWLWFASPNLRLRLSLVMQTGQLQQATWYSEIRRPSNPAQV